MKNPVRVAKRQALQQLEKIALHTQKNKYPGKSTQKSRHNLFWFIDDQDRVVCKIQQYFTFTRGSGIPVTEDESINFFRSWWRNSKTR